MADCTQVRPRATDFLLSGVGGQGTILAADVLALVGMALGMDVKKSEVHGMAQRGGSVISQVRWARRVFSPLITPGQADVLLAFERLEALRYATQLRPGGLLLINDYRIAPITVSSGTDSYPTQEQEDSAYGDRYRRYYIPAIEIARALGQPRVSNVVMIGALAAMVPVENQVWLDVIAQRVPERYVELNQQAFTAGREHMPTSLGTQA
jgi:indolepyruvate ferredoxin oxidoreductase, beta subunit